MDQIAGTWRLIAASATSGGDRNDAPYGPNPSGFITYTGDGRVMAIISHSGRKPLASGDRISASVDERAEAFATSFSYAGRYSLAGDRIVHHVRLKQETPKPRQIDGGRFDDARRFKPRTLD